MKDEEYYKKRIVCVELFDINHKIKRKNIFKLEYPLSSPNTETLILYENKCVNCGKMFTSQRIRTKYCSKNCSSQAQQLRVKAREQLLKYGLYNYKGLYKPTTDLYLEKKILLNESG